MGQENGSALGRRSKSYYKTRDTWYPWNEACFFISKPCNSLRYCRKLLVIGYFPKQDRLGRGLGSTEQGSRNIDHAWLRVAVNHGHWTSRITPPPVGLCSRYLSNFILGINSEITRLPCGKLTFHYCLWFGGRQHNSNWTSHQQGKSLDYGPHRTYRRMGVMWPKLNLSNTLPQGHQLWAADGRMWEQ